jgi:penicillin-insensitive murein DD-endopeptidase
LRIAILKLLVKAAILCCITPIQAVSEPEARQLFGAKRMNASMASYPYGGYAKGCLAGAAQLPETGPTWQAMRLSRNRNWGHPETIDYIKSLSEKASALPGWDGLYIGDISQPRGGPMISGHRSHQIGLDVDIWMLPATNLKLSKKSRENISSVSLQKSNGAYVNNKWSQAHHHLLKAAASDKRVARVFVFPGAKVKMCEDEKGNREWLHKIRPWWGHHYHFHVRLKCPTGLSKCKSQAPPPSGAGCEEAQGWVNRILNPPPHDPDAPRPKSRRELTMTDLPKHCSQVLTSK